MNFRSWRTAALLPIASHRLPASSPAAPAGHRTGGVRRKAAAAVLVLALAGAGAAGYLPIASHLAAPTAIVAAATNLTLPSAAAAPATAAEVQDTIRQVIERANAEQAQAIAARDPSVMAGTSTAEHYQSLVQTNQSLLQGGVTRIELVTLEWGPVVVQGNNATATTFETWRTTASNGATEQSRDRNLYVLVLDGGSWKIQDNTHPGNIPADPSTPASPGQTPPASGVVPNSASSRNWSGYAATGSDFTAVHGTWTIPQPSNDSAAGLSAAWVGIGGVRSRDLIQAGTQETVSGTGRVRYEAWIETLPDAAETVPLTVRPGDSVSVAITQQGADTWQVSLTNDTTTQNYQRSVHYASSQSSVEWVEEAPSTGRGQVLPLGNFGTIKFTAGSAVENGQTVNMTQAGVRPITMVAANGQALAVPSSIGADGASFSVSRTDVQAPAAGSSGGGGGQQPTAPGRGRGRARSGF